MLTLYPRNVVLSDNMAHFTFKIFWFFYCHSWLKCQIFLCPDVDSSLSKWCRSIWHCKWLCPSPNCLKDLKVQSDHIHMFICGLPEEARHAAVLCYADDITLIMRIPTGKRETSAALLNSDIERILYFGKKWLLEFESKKTKAITISKKGYGDYPWLWMEKCFQRTRHWMS